MSIPNKDLTTIFAGYGATGIANNTNYQNSSGIDLRYIYAPYSTGAYALPTNLYTTLNATINPAVDLCTIFAPYISGSSTNTSYEVNDLFTISNGNLTYKVYTYLDSSKIMHYGIFFDSGKTGDITFNKLITGASVLAVGGGGRGGSNQYYYQYPTYYLFAGSGGGGGGITYLEKQTLNGKYRISVGIGAYFTPPSTFIDSSASTFSTSITTYTSDPGTSCLQTSIYTTQVAGNGGNGFTAGGGGGGAGAYPGVTGGSAGDGETPGDDGMNGSDIDLVLNAYVFGGAGGNCGGYSSGLVVLNGQMTLYLGGGGGGGSGVNVFPYSAYNNSGFAGLGKGGNNNYLVYPYAGQESISAINLVSGSTGTYVGNFGNGGGGSNYAAGFPPAGGNGTVAIFFSEPVSMPLI